MKKYRLYIDEVGNADLKSSSNPNHRYLSLTGVIFDLEYIRHIVHEQMEAFKRKYFNSHPDEPVVLHRKELLQRKYPFKILKDDATAKQFNNDLLHYLKQWHYQVISVVIDKKEHQERYQVWRHDPYHYCIEILLERFYFYLANNNALGDVMIESRGGKEDKRLKNSYTRIFNNGTNFIRPEYLQRHFTTKNLKVKPKHLNITGLQVADLLAYPARRHIFMEYDIKKVDKPTFNDEVIKVLLEKFYNRKGKINGIGIKMLP